MILFSSEPGTVAAVPSGIPLSLSIVRIANGFSFDTHKTIVTGIQASENVSMQLQHMFSGQVHITTFKDKLGRMVFAGKSFASTCVQAEVKHGIESMKEWYDKNKISVNTRPTRLVLGSSLRYDCIIHSSTFNVSDTSMRIADWSIETYYL